MLTESRRCFFILSTIPDPLIACNKPSVYISNDWCRAVWVVSANESVCHGSVYFILAGYTYCSLRLEVDNICASNMLSIGCGMISACCKLSMISAFCGMISAVGIWIYMSNKTKKTMFTTMSSSYIQLFFVQYYREEKPWNFCMRILMSVPF